MCVLWRLVLGVQVGYFYFLTLAEPTQKKLEGEGEDEEAQRWGVYRQVLQGDWQPPRGLLALKHGKCFVCA